MASLARLFRRLVRLAVVLIGLILIGLAVLHLPPVRARVLDRVRGYAAQELGMALQASSLGYNVLTRTIELRDLSLAATPRQSPFPPGRSRGGAGRSRDLPRTAHDQSASRSRGRG